MSKIDSSYTTLAATFIIKQALIVICLILAFCKPTARFIVRFLIRTINFTV
jgi:hypothetical protein